MSEQPRPPTNPAGGVEDRVLDHDYDGIREYDNPLPGWWVALFWGSIIFAGIYIPWIHMGPGLVPLEEYAREMKEAAAEAKLRPLPPIDFAAALADPARAAAGRTVYDKLCVACHRPDAGGLVGPNLTDDHWIHGGRLEDLVQTVTEGVPAKGMISWKSQLSRDEIVAVSVYVKTLRGTNPPNPKAPEGEPSLE